MRMIKTDITNIGDPFILLHDGTYYMYATSAPDGFLYFKSDNLIDWENCGYAYKGGKYGEKDYWAPEVYERNGKFYMIFTARWKEKHSLRIFVAVSDSPEGPFVDYTDGPLFDFGYAAIDATLFKDDDGKDYLYFVRDCSEQIIDGVHTSSIYVCEISEDLRTLLGEPTMISIPDAAWEKKISSEWRWNEGPCVLKRNGKYILNYSVNCYDSLYYSVGASESVSPKGPFIKYENNPILKYKEGEFSGPGHNSFFYDKSGRLLTAFHIHTHYDKPSGNRRACIAKVAFDDKNKLIIDL